MALHTAPLNRLIALVLLALLAPATSGEPVPENDLPSLDGFVEQLKRRPLGPFEAVSWHCADGSVLPPRPYACKDYGGGYQYGRWDLQTLLLRENGYFIGNILAATTPEELTAETNQSELQLTSILIEKFLIAADDGWIFRRARFARGVMQDEDESNAAIYTLLRLVSHPNWRDSRHLLIRESARLLPRKGALRSLTRLRGLATSIAEVDENFLTLRNKIHSSPDAEDAQRVREYRDGLNDPALTTQLDALADAIDAVYRKVDIAKTFRRFGNTLKEWKIGGVAWRGAENLAQATTPEERLRITAGVMLSLRSKLVTYLPAEARLRAIDTSLAAELAVFTAGREILAAAANKSRRALLEILLDNSRALYGSGLLTLREWRALNDTIKTVLNDEQLTLSKYREALNYMERTSHWATRRLAFHFQPAIEKLAELDSEAREFIPDRLRGSPAMLHADLLDILLSDAQRLSGVKQEIFGRPVASGLRALNPGVAEGELTDIRNLRGGAKRRAVVITPETTAELPRVAGIVTAEAGNSLSHVQLLARNLDVPNVLVSGGLLQELGRFAGRDIFIAASPRGVVQIREADAETAAVVAAELVNAPMPLQPDLDKLQLDDMNLRPLSRLRGDDSGRTVGPKAARLGELSHHFPGHVSPGLAIPFGVFRAVLEQPRSAEDPQPMIEWLRHYYAQIERLQDYPERRDDLVVEVLSTLRHWLQEVALPEPFVVALRLAMAQEFGEEGSYGVFVRSDTNIEDLPNFSGAGLNLTVPNVVGFDNVLEAVRRVWASAFTERSWGWRQAMIPDAEHVYPAVLLHKSVNADKSGVLVSLNTETGARDAISVVVNEGVGGGVAGQAAENMLLTRTGKNRLLSSATEPMRTILKPEGGVGRERASGRAALASPAELDQLRALVAAVENKGDVLLGPDAADQAADIEFGFLDGQLVLFQIRPFIDSTRARHIAYLKKLDERLNGSDTLTVDLQQKPVTVSGADAL